MSKKYDKREKSQTFFGTVNDDEEHVISIFFSQNSICFNYTSAPNSTPPLKGKGQISQRSASVPNASAAVQGTESTREKKALSLDSSVLASTNHAPITKKSALKKESALIDEDKYIRAHAMFNFTPAEKDEIPLQVGDVVFIFNMHESGWWTGDCNGKYGIFPGAYVKIDEDQKSKTLKRDPIKELAQLDTVIWSDEGEMETEQIKDGKRELPPSSGKREIEESSLPTVDSPKVQWISKDSSSDHDPETKGLKNKLSMLEIELAKEREKSRKLEAELSDLKLEMKEKTEGFEMERRAFAEQLEELNAKLTGEIEERIMTQHELQAMKDSQNYELEEAESALATLRQKLQDAEDFRELMESQLNAARHQVDIFRVEGEQQRDYVTSMKAELSDKQSELDNLYVKCDEEANERKRLQQDLEKLQWTQIHDFNSIILC